MLLSILTSAKCLALHRGNSAGTVEIAIFNYANSKWEQIKLVLYLIQLMDRKELQGFCNSRQGRISRELLSKVIFSRFLWTRQQYIGHSVTGCLGMGGIYQKDFFHYSKIWSRNISVISAFYGKIIRPTIIAMKRVFWRLRRLRRTRLYRSICK